VVLNPLKWSSLTWLVFLPWLALAVLANLGATEYRDGSGARVDHFGWPLTHTEAWYPANSASATHQETSYLFAIVDVLAVVSVQLSIIVVAPHWPRRFSVRALLLLTTLVATLFAMGRVIVADKVLSALAMNATDAIAYCLYFLPLAVWCGAFVFCWFGVRRFSDTLLPVAVVGALVGLVVLSAWEYIPGTLCCDANGFPHGTGKKEYYYDSGALMIEEWYRAGVQTKTTWYRPDGTHIATSAFDKETGGVGLFLRQDGSIRCQMHFRYSPSEKLYLAHGTATDFAPDGSVVKTVEYRDGAPAEGQQGAVGKAQPAAAVFGPDAAIAHFVGDWSSDGEHVYSITGDADTGATLCLVLKENVAAEVDDARIDNGRLRFRSWFFVDGHRAIPSDEPMEIVLSPVDDCTLTQETRLLLPNGELFCDTVDLTRIVGK
jgi:hypothetical protein